MGVSDDDEDCAFRGRRRFVAAAAVAPGTNGALGWLDLMHGPVGGRGFGIGLWRSACAHVLAAGEGGELDIYPDGGRGHGSSEESVVSLVVDSAPSIGHRDGFSNACHLVPLRTKTHTLGRCNRNALVDWYLAIPSTPHQLPFLSSPSAVCVSTRDAVPA